MNDDNHEDVYFKAVYIDIDREPLHISSIALSWTEGSEWCAIEIVTGDRHFLSMFFFVASNISIIHILHNHNIRFCCIFMIKVQSIQNKTKKWLVFFLHPYIQKPWTITITLAANDQLKVWCTLVYGPHWPVGVNTIVVYHWETDSKLCISPYYLVFQYGQENTLPKHYAKWTE